MLKFKWSLLAFACLIAPLLTFLSGFRNTVVAEGETWGYGVDNGNLIITDSSPVDGPCDGRIEGRDCIGTFYIYVPGTFYQFRHGGAQTEFIWVDDWGNPTHGRLQQGNEFSDISILWPDLFYEWFPEAGGGTGDPGDISVTVEAKYNQSPNGKALAPDTLTLKNQKGEILQTTETNSPEWRSDPEHFFGTFENLDPASYIVCSKLINVCSDGQNGNPPPVDLNGGRFELLLRGNTVPVFADGSVGDGDTGISCKVGAFTWLICPLIEIARGTSSFIIESVIEPFLTISPLEADGTEADGDPANAAFIAWRVFRTFANALLIIAFFVIIFSQALSLNIEAYTIKKIMPRLVIAVIAIQLSFYAVAFLVDATNVLGQGASTIILTPIAEQGIEIFEGAGAATGVAGGVTVILAVLGALLAKNLGIATLFGGAPSLLLFLIPVIISLVVVFFTIVIRQVLIIALAVASPLAFVAWILPNTERFFKMWRDFLLKALMMYPLIVLLMTSGTIVAILASDLQGGTEEFVGTLIALGAVVAPLFMIPLTFKFAGTAIAAVGGAIQKLSNNMAYGKEGKTGIAAGLRARMAEDKKNIAAGVAPSNWLGKQLHKSNYLRKSAARGARPGFGWGKRAESEAFLAHRIEEGEAAKNLEAEGVGDPKLLAQAADVMHDTKLFDERVEKLKAGEVAGAGSLGDQQAMAGRLEAIRRHAGNRAYSMALAKRAFEIGAITDSESEPDKVDRVLRAVHGSFAGNPHLQAQVISDVTFAGREANPDVWRYSATIENGESVLNPNDWGKLTGYLTKTAGEDQASKLKEWGGIDAQGRATGTAQGIRKVFTDIEEAEAEGQLDRATELRANANQLVGNLRRWANSEKFTADAKSSITGILLGLGMPISAPHPYQTDFFKEELPPVQPVKITEGP